MTETEETFGQWMRKEREAQGLTQEELGRMVGITKQAIYALEARMVKDPTKATAEKIEMALLEHSRPPVARDPQETIKALEYGRAVVVRNWLAGKSPQGFMVAHRLGQMIQKLKGVPDEGAAAMPAVWRKGGDDGKR